MKDLQTLVAKLGKSHWIVLRQSFEGWTFLISGKYPLNWNFGRISELEAKEAASAAAKEHLRRHGLERELADVSELFWRVAVRYTVA